MFFSLQLLPSAFYGTGDWKLTAAETKDTMMRDMCRKESLRV